MSNAVTEVEKAWKLLNHYGIYTMEEFEKARKENQLDIKVFITPLNSTSSN